MTSTTDIFRSDLFAGQVVIVTGGATGIGREIALGFAGLGATLAVGSRDKDGAKLPLIEGELRARGADAVTQRLDIRKPDEIAAFLDAVLARFGKIDVLVNNAGGQFPGPACEYTPRGWEAVIATNLTGTFLVTQAVAKRWMLEHGGRICSIVANMWRGFPGLAHTGAARAGVVNLTKSLAVEWASAGIRINAVAPGAIASSGFAQYPDEVLRLTKRAIPLKRFGRCEEVAAAVLYLCSPAADYITGETLCIDGGAPLWGDIFPIPDPPDFEDYDRQRGR